MEGRAKVNIQTNGQIDTGFMLNSIYTVTPKSSGYGAALSQARSKTRSKTGQQVKKDDAMAPARSLEGKDVRAAVICGANYAIFQEQSRSFLFAAAETVAREAGGIAEAIYRERLND